MQAVLDGGLDASFRHGGHRFAPPKLRIHSELYMPPGGMPDSKKPAAHGSLSVVQTSLGQHNAGF